MNDRYAEVRNAIEQTFVKSGTRLFYRSSFDGICNRDEAYAALLKLAAEGLLTPRVAIYCPDGHSVWEGTPAEAAKLKPFECPECYAEIDDPKAAAEGPTFFVAGVCAFPGRKSQRPELVNLDTKYLSLPGHECKCHKCLHMRGIVVIGNTADTLETVIYMPTRLNEVGFSVSVDISPLLPEQPPAPMNRAERRARRGR